jgi:hypothetical protein
LIICTYIHTYIHIYIQFPCDGSECCAAHVRQTIYRLSRQNIRVVYIFVSCQLRIPTTYYTYRKQNVGSTKKTCRPLGSRRPTSPGMTSDQATPAMSTIPNDKSFQHCVSGCLRLGKPIGSRPIQTPVCLSDISISLCLGLFLSFIDSSIVATSLYSIGTDFNDLETVNWVALSYTLCYLGFAVFFARISDVIGRRDAFLTAFVLFFAFSIGCGFAQSMNQLIACRAFQGIGGSGEHLKMKPYLAVMVSNLSRPVLHHNDHPPRDYPGSKETVPGELGRHRDSHWRRSWPGSRRNPDSLRQLALGILDQVCHIVQVSSTVLLTSP